MRRVSLLILLGLLAGSAIGCRSSSSVLFPVLYAQSLPATLTASWAPNPASDNVLDYQVTLDGGASVTVLASACTATRCSTAISVGGFGAHTAVLVARNRGLSTDPADVQSGPAVSLAFVLSAAPGAVSGGGIGR